MTETMQQPADMIARLGRKWGWVLAYGIITLAAGVAVLVWPGETLLVIAVLFGVQLIVSGIFRFVAALAIDDLAGGTRVLLALLAVLSVILGLWAVRHVQLTLLVLAALLGIFWVVNGHGDTLARRGTQSHLARLHPHLADFHPHLAECHSQQH
jgi:uncharacterized membrane protein HdeD (DUF308 family)